MKIKLWPGSGYKKGYYLKILDLIKKMIGSSNGKMQTDEKDVINAPLAMMVLLLEAAYADAECSGEKKAHLVETLVTNFGISREGIDILLEDKDKESREYVDFFQYTRFINENFSGKQKIDIMESVWRIILLDDHLEAHENHFAHKLANLIHLNHPQLIDAKLRARK